MSYLPLFCDSGHKKTKRECPEDEYMGSFDDEADRGCRCGKDFLFNTGICKNIGHVKIPIAVPFSSILAMVLSSFPSFSGGVTVLQTILKRA